MKINVKTLLLCVSLFLNGIVALLVGFSVSVNNKNASFHFPAPPDDYTAAAAIAVCPPASDLVFCPVEVTLKPTEKFFLQYAVIIDKKQSYVLFNALFDPDIISVQQTASGIIVTARQKGQTLLQFFSNDGIKDLAAITVNE